MTYQPEQGGPANQPHPPGSQPYQHPGGLYQPAYYAPAPTAGMSLTSMIIGIANMVGFGMTIVTPIVGVIFGHIGLRKEQPQGRTFAIVGLVLNYASLLLFALFWLFLGGLFLTMWAAMGYGNPARP
ncbi:MAG: DUF4190 domain-containing protein [Acidobacteria bacterium]|nr:DUF4190 domain-containing protein [Acidobacteriota bacterium]